MRGRKHDLLRRCHRDLLITSGRGAVRDPIHSHYLIAAFDAFFRAPRGAEVYDIGGGRFSNASVIEAIQLSEEIAGDVRRILEEIYVANVGRWRAG